MYSPVAVNTSPPPDVATPSTSTLSSMLGEGEHAYFWNTNLSSSTHSLLGVQFRGISGSWNFDLGTSTAWQIGTFGWALFFLLTWAVMWMFHVVALVHGKWRLHRKRILTSTDVEASLPGVSILKPLCSGADPNLFSNLETFFTLQYPKYELLICIQEKDDSRLRMYAESLMSKYPNIDSQVFYGGENVGVNPKINNMQPGYKAAKYELILVSDSGIRMDPDTLMDMVSCMSDKVGLVHQMPFACDRNGIPATLEKVYFGTSHARAYLTANFLGINCATGMSSLMKKSVLDKVGGFETYGCYLAEDYFMAQTFLDEGMQIDISSKPAQQSPGDSSIGGFMARITRWSKLRGAMCPHLLFFEPISECMLLGALSAWSVRFLFGWDPFSFFLVHVLLWFLMDWTLLHIVQNGVLPFNKFEFMVLWLFREVSAPYIFMSALKNPSIIWRSKEFRLKWGGKAEAVPVTTNLL